MGEGAHLLVDGDTAVVAHTLVGVGRDVEDAGLAAVGVAHQGHVDGLRALLGDVVHGVAVRRLQGAVVVVVHNLLLGLSLADNLHLTGIAAPQRHLEVHDTVFYRVLQRGVEHRLHGDALDETHLYDAFAESPVTRYAHHHGALTSL